MNFWGKFFDFISAPFRMLLSAPVALISAPRRLVGMSLPARVAVLLAIFLLLITITDFGLFVWTFKNAAEWKNKIWFSLGAAALSIILPLVVYQTLNLWLRGHVSRFPDIDLAWKQGLSALEKRGLDISSLPVFLVVGARDHVQAKSLFRASGLSLSIPQTPEGPAALHWFVEDRGIFLVCTGASQLGRLSSLVQASPEPTGGMMGGESAPPSPAGLRDTIASDRGGMRQTGVFSSSAESPAAAPPPMNLRGTMEIRSTGNFSNDSGKGAASVALNRYLSKDEGDEQTARLNYVCDLLRRAREPVCPMNGLLTILPYEVMQRSASQGLEVQNAAKTDLRTIRDSTRLRCSTIALVAGMESEQGFREMIRRVGLEPVKAQRFGKGFGVWNPPTGEQLEAVAHHACGAFEDCIYKLFRDRDGHNKPGNPKLYSLLCKIRGEFKERLGNILGNAFAADEKEGENAEPLLFSGCYFAASGDTEDRQGFVRSVIEKLFTEEIELEWTEQALREDARCGRLAVLGMMASAALALSIVGMFVWNHFNKA